MSTKTKPVFPKLNPIAYNPLASLPKNLYQRERQFYFNQLESDRQYDRSHGVKTGRRTWGTPWDGGRATDAQIGRLIHLAGSVERANRILGDSVYSIRFNEARFFAIRYFEQERALHAGDVDIWDVRPTFVLKPLPDAIRPVGGRGMG